MSASIVRQHVSRSIAASSFTRCSRSRILQSRAQPFLKPAVRSFTASSSAAEKRYTKDHEWVELSADKTIGTIGISTYAANALGDVVYVELPTAESEVSSGDSIGAVESVKSASDILSPISGVVVEANSALEEKPAAINKSPESDGWLAKIRVTSPEELETLMDADAYRSFTEEAESK